MALHWRDWRGGPATFTERAGRERWRAERRLARPGQFPVCKTVPSYGVGVRFMVLKAKRINMRLDFAWSDDSDAIHFSVGEAF